ncbi:hypothetical protein [Acidicapsa ligni]|uniref:hypothetical protein n=1 Tax=Acidicapsa ligni TaxID=542300 RepID=UPI0021DF6C4A|nr:hypothetical protein [Acidicapsa ligni]
MNSNKVTNLLLLVIAVAVTVIAFRPYSQPVSVQAQTTANASWYIEPGVQVLLLPQGGQVLGKVAVDLNTGNIWGFPTYNNNSYPISQTAGGKPAISHPFSLGRFAVEDIDKSH